MRASLKISLSLLISVVLCSGFTFIAFSGLFDFLDSTFYNPRVKAEYQNRALSLQERIAGYHRTNLERFKERLKPSYIINSFETSLKAEEIAKREKDFAKLQEQFPSLIMFRLVDKNLRQLHYSTYTNDVKSRTERSITYLLLNQLDDSISQDWLLKEDGSPKVNLDGGDKRFIYTFPVNDTLSGVFKGTALFYASINDLYEKLLMIPDYNYGPLLPIEKFGFVANFPEEKLDLIYDEVLEEWGKATLSEEGILMRAVLNGEDYLFFTAVDEIFGNIGVLSAAKNFEMQLSMKIILLISVYLTVFLVVFLIFNLRQDPLVILSQRIKRFQIDFFKDFVESKGSLDWERWKRDLSLRAPVIKKQIKSGIGRIKKYQQAEVDGLIDRSWNEIITAIGAQTEKKAAPGFDITRIEEILQRVVESGQFTAVAQQIKQPVEPVKLSHL